MSGQLKMGQIFDDLIAIDLVIVSNAGLHRSVFTNTLLKPVIFWLIHYNPVSESISTGTRCYVSILKCGIGFDVFFSFVTRLFLFSF